MAKPPTTVVPPEAEGERLDRALLRLLPESGLRERQRLIRDGRVLVDGRPRPKGYLVRAGETLSIAPGPSPSLSDPCAKVRVVASSDLFAALLKPAGLHTEPLKGREGYSLADCLPNLLPGYVRLLNRLDFLTSGLVLAARHESGSILYREAEDAGRVAKHYLALVHGNPSGELLLARALDTDNRRVTKVLPYDSPDPVRHTLVRPLLFMPGRDATLVRVLIRKGARHQIRAHLAAAGHPIVGDPLYGPDPESTHLYLHHFRLELDAFTAQALPDWPDVELPPLP